MIWPIRNLIAKIRVYRIKNKYAPFGFTPGGAFSLFIVNFYTKPSHLLDIMSGVNS